MKFSNRNASKGLGGIEQLLSDLGSLLSSKELDSIPQIRDVRERLSDGVGRVRDTVAHAAEETATRTRDAARVSNEYAHEEPWRVAGAALAVGAVIGFCLARR
ncbi:glycine zipper domain-containing protein [Diaphorobacter aerolatus]|uniref:DUF883 family protein n=1 Tax=Diaphorobacter aerolatus TaxID=1288495 RepID=A0A7H0GKX6_9BURK|nr:DUF883 family protein [Diaphorobacter aerolatus]QNP48942.1 DUF883 family protein [Diaphorobacter aerolatus]